MQHLRADQVDFVEFSIRGKEYDVKFFGVRAVKLPSQETPYWEIEFDDGTIMITTDPITIRISKKKK
ncbi:MAG: hypothetical protein Q7V48_03465 [Deltaproteobacteria bacterium]|nr:hypothetical protein [Deltaproteobacteria bacterium]MDO9209795.1 hypothetical protein [Deltaproteobacteria bacterium]